jgi:phenylacetate-CoA ligase
VTLRGRAYLALHALARNGLPRHYRRFASEDRARRYRDPIERLGSTLADAAQNVPHYRGLVSASEARSDPLGSLSRFPILTRETIRENGEDLLSEVGDRRQWTHNTSGGSTGEPVELLQDPDHWARTVAAREVYSTWVGGGLGRPELLIWGSEQDVEGARMTLRNQAATRLLRRSFLNAFMLSEDSMRAIAERIASGPPNLVIAYAQAGYELARFIAEEEIQIPAQVGAIATAGTLYDFMREQLEESFRCVVVNRYGSREIGDIAGECPNRSGLHVLPWVCHVEVLDDDDRPAASGQEGDVVVTGFTNRAMPLIRYRIGDRATAADPGQPCACGRRTQMLGAVVGRSVDLFVAADGRLVDGEYFTHLLYFRTWLKQFQVAQTSPERVVYRLVVRSPVPDEDRAELIEKTKLALGTACEVELELVDEIAPSASGKLRYTLREF